MPAIPSSFLILQNRFNFSLKPFVYSLTHNFASCSSLASNYSRKFPIFRPPFPSNVRVRSITSQAASTESLSDNGSGGGRSGALSPAPINEDVQKIDVNPPKGTRDFAPEDMRLRNWLFNNFREVSLLYGFEEVDFPVLETEALFSRKAGEEIRDQGFNRKGKLRAICGGGRYDRLFSTFGADDVPACGFGFGDAVIMEDKGLLPELSLQVENIVCALDLDLQGAAAMVATILREKGKSVDLVLESKPLK